MVGRLFAQLAGLLTVTVLGGLLAGCGSGDKASSTTRSATRAQAVAYAHAINLHAGDVPGMTSTGVSEHEGTKESRASSELARCAGGVGSTHQIVDIESGTFVRGEGLEKQQVQSGVSVLSRAALAAQELAAIRSSRGRECITRLAQQQLAKSAGSVRFSGVRTSPLPAGLVGRGDTFGLRVSLTLTVSGNPTRIPLYLDFLGFISGPAEVDLNTYGISKPVPAVTERRLLSLLMNRAKSHSL